jgi:hypothetical protein
MLRTLVERDPIFQGETRENGWRSRLTGRTYDPHLGTGLVKIGADGLPVAWMTSTSTLPLRQSSLLPSTLSWT